MKRSGTTITFIVVWAAVLFAALVIGICIREVRFQHAKIDSTKNIETETSSKIQTPSETDRLVEELAQKSPIPRPEDAEMPGTRFPEEGPGSEELRGNMRERFANMSEEEKAQMRERFGPRGRRGGGRSQNMTEEERAKFREEMEELRERWEEMSEEEREEARSQISKKYGFVPRIGLGGRPGGNRGPRSEEGGGRRSSDNDGNVPPPKGRACFVAETPVWIDDKLVKISKVNAGQAVGRQFLEQVQEHEGTFECRNIVLESGNTISVVDAHCFMLDSGQWMAAQNLTSNLRLKTPTGTVGIKSVTKRAVPYTGKVYNLKVKNSDKYMVSKDMVIVRDY
jgi:hypothetical protein